MILSKEEHLKRLDLLERPMYDFEREDVQWGYGQLIKKVFDEDTKNPEHTANFKHFHLLAGSTLKQWGKEALIDYIHTLYHNWQSSDISYKCVMDYAINLQNEIEKLKSYDTPQFTVEEIDSIQTLVDLEMQKCDRAYGKYTEGLKKLLNKLQKQKKLLEKK